MKKQAIFHHQLSNYAFAISKTEVILRLRVDKRDNFKEVSIIYGMKYNYYLKQEKIMMSRAYEDELFAYYEVLIKVNDPRFVYVFYLVNDNETYYFSEEGLATNYDFKNAYYNCFQIPYINEVDLPQPIAWTKNAVFYQIFVDRFNMGDDHKDQSYINLKWGDKPQTQSFAGGDLQGIIDKLDYLLDLGITALYLTPIFSSVSNHKYDINDYYKIDRQFGDEATFKRLVTLAHEKGLKIILDGVFNHTSDLLSEFDDVFKLGKKSKYFDWFIIHGDKIDKKTVNYETFSNCYYHPKFNTDNPEVRRFLIDIGKYYVEHFNIDGWRLDVSDEVSHSFWRQFRAEVKSINKDVLIFGENWHDANAFLKGDQFDSIMNYAFTKAMLDLFAFRTSNAETTAFRLNKLLLRNHQTITNQMINLLDSHDTDRFYQLVNEDKNKLLQALVISFFYSGVPMIYYGTELPLIGGYDPDNRRCMTWDKLDTNSEYFKTLKHIISLKKNPLLQTGSINIYHEDTLLIIERFDLNKKLKLTINTGNTKKIINPKSVFSHRYDNDAILHADGFIISEEAL